MNRQKKTRKIIMLLRQKLAEADDSSLAGDEYHFTQWTQEVEGILARSFGKRSRQLENFETSLNNEVFIQRNFDEAENTEYRRRQISYAKAALSAILSEISTFSFPVGTWIKRHRGTVSWTTIALIIIALLGTNWESVINNIQKLLKLFGIGP